MKTLSMQKTSPENTTGWWTEEDITDAEADSILEGYHSPHIKKKYAVRDLLKTHFSEYCLSHQVPEFKLKTVNAMIACKTGDLGYRLVHCKQCGKIEMRSCACGNRNCPSCGYLEEKRWTAMRQSEVIPGIPYFHMVFTLPHTLNGVMYQNQKESLNLLFSSARDTILQLSMSKLKMTPGILMVLHSFSSDLNLHYHLHVLVSGGGLTKDRTEFKRCLSNTFFLPWKAVEKTYKGKFMSGLKQLYTDKKLEFFHKEEKYRNRYNWQELVDGCYDSTWNIDIKYLAPAKEKGQDPVKEETADDAVTYFAHYTNRTAISNNRIVMHDPETVRFRYKQYHGSSYTKKEMDLSPEEFIRRFLLHILPPGFNRVRTAGFLAGCVRTKNLKLIHRLLGQKYAVTELKKMTGIELILHFFGKDVTVCKHCGNKVEIIPRMDKKSAAVYIRGQPTA